MKNLLEQRREPTTNLKLRILSYSIIWCGVFSVNALLKVKEKKRREGNDNHNNSQNCALYLFDLFLFNFFFQILAPVGIVHFLPSSFVIIFVGYKNR